LKTIEFFPEEGKYHLDGHRDCKLSCFPEETKKLKGICPKCGKKLLLGVMHRVDDLGDREVGFMPNRAIPFVNTIPLEEIIAETFDMGTTSKKVFAMYEHMVSKASEFSILLDLKEEEIIQVSNAQIAQSIMRVRNGKVNIEPGYDGVFGKIMIYSEEELLALNGKLKQASLF
jgi:PHP family Zn ribbon phosphoesterase